MGELLFPFKRFDPTSWAYLASLLVIALYFKFSRFWSVRNLDLVGLILLAPPLLLVKYGIDHRAVDETARTIEHVGYIWLFAVSGLFMLRLLLDATMVRRPLLEPNLSVGGLAFLGVSVFSFIAANIILGTPDRADLKTSQRAADLQARTAEDKSPESLSTHGPGFPLLYLLPHISTQSLLGRNGNAPAVAVEPPSEQPTARPDEAGSGDTGSENEVAVPPPAIPLVHIVTARVVAILSQLAIIIGMVLVGMRHFDNVKTGVAAATLYLLLPYTAMWTGNSTHVLPGALVAWAVVLYRRPLLSGALIGLACGTIYYPVFLLPLWSSFYWRRGLGRFLFGVLAMVALMIGALALVSSDSVEFMEKLRQMFGVRFPQEAVAGGMNGAWSFWNPIYRVPILAAFVALSLSLALWPAQKNLGTLLAYSGAVMLGTQFWHAHTGGLALAWYLPFLVLTIFRPNLEDRSAMAVVK